MNTQPGTPPNTTTVQPVTRFLGIPLDGFSFFPSLLLTLASGIFAFCVVTCVAIFALLIWNQLLHHSVNYADTYLWVGLPAAILVWAVSLVVFGTLWLRAQIKAK